MGVIGQIRQRSTLLMVIIGVAMLLFILGDVLSSGGGLFGGGQPTDVAEIAGESISQRDFEERVLRILDQRPDDQPADDRARSSAQEQAWNMLLQERVFVREYDKLGLNVSKEELFEQIKNTSPNSQVSQYFTNPQTGQLYQDFMDPQTGGLNSQAVMGYLQQVLKTDEKGSWIQFEQALKMDRYSSKYFTMISKGLFATDLQATNDFQSSNRRFGFSYVTKPYSDIEDSKVEPTESELKAYYNAHKTEPEFQQEDSKRSFDYIVFEVLPSEDDLAELHTELKELKPKFALDSNDTVFVLDHYAGVENITYTQRGEFPLEVDSLIFDGEVGTVVGPFEQNGYLKITKVLGEKISSDSVRARHILLPVPQGDTAAERKQLDLADSLLAVIKSDDNFPAMAMQYSADQQAAKNAVEGDWFTSNIPVPAEFGTALFDGTVEEIVIVQSPIGVHLIEVLEKDEETRKAFTASIDREILPSKNTRDAIYKAASTFSINNRETEDFKAAASGLAVLEANDVGEFDKEIAGLGAAGELIRWAFAAEQNAVSDAKQVDNAFVVAHVSKVSDKGVLSLESVKDMVTQEVMKEKKAQMIIDEMKSYSNLEELAQTIGATVEPVEALTFSSYFIPGVNGTELEVIGKIAAMKQGELSTPIKGEVGVYMVRLDNVVEAPNAPDLASARRDLNQQAAGRVGYPVFEALKESAKVQDNRAKFGY